VLLIETAGREPRFPDDDQHSFHNSISKMIHHETNVNFGGAYISAIRLSTSKSNGSMGSFTHWRTPRNKEK
jgi:hypothetical protein